MLDFQLVSYFTNFAVQNVNKAFVHITDLTSTLTKNLSKLPSRLFINLEIFLLKSSFGSIGVVFFQF